MKDTRYIIMGIEYGNYKGNIKYFYNADNKQFIKDPTQATKYRDKMSADITLSRLCRPDYITSYRIVHI